MSGFEAFGAMGDFGSLYGLSDLSVTAGAANAAGLSVPSAPYATVGSEAFGPPAPKASAESKSTWGIPNSQWQQGAQAMNAGGRAIGQAANAQAAAQPRLPGGGAPRPGNPNLLASYVQSLQQKREALLPRVPGLLNRQGGGGGGGGFGGGGGGFGGGGGGFGAG